jgi:hypothetical protein
MLEKFQTIYDPDIRKSYPKIELSNMFKQGLKLSLEEKMRLKIEKEEKIKRIQ